MVGIIDVVGDSRVNNISKVRIIGYLFSIFLNIMDSIEFFYFLTPAHEPILVHWGTGLRGFWRVGRIEIGLL